MIQSILIANRGEIAVRVVRACKEMGIRSVMVYSEADKDSLAVRMADDAVCIGPAPASESYLKPKNLISAAVLKRCDAIHPGVGFLSESPGFAKAVADAGLIWIGPPAATIGMLGDKVEAKRSAIEAGVPVIPGSDGPITDVADARKQAKKMGYPVIVKAASGGGGKGMRIVRSEDDLEGAIKIASNEAEKAFSDGTVYMEKYLENPRHVEVQILADSYGNVVHLGERDCSVQFKHQKLVEESPSTAVDEKTRAKMGKDTVSLFKSLDYVGAGTIEFLLYEGQHYFMEVNARVQVEHPVTELVTGIDIIREQIKVCGGEKLSFSQDDINVSGYAVECRINARTPGRITEYLPPGGYGVRIDSFLYPGYMVSPFYDSLVAKVLTYGRDRNEGLDRMNRVLDELVLEGITTNCEEQKRIINHPVFRSGAFGTGFLEQIEEEA
ncbi:acetyl-CoA carboxylase biotin carboxylase subunit [Spirochaeta africana]|uniref:biotin carboxylase n=1 Tax=Spirochaeta africana (strain ATCC 700263 / DSM 8902 / Z-7692) TaxID=889378 RepID=H9UL56_SPIAZ|nr:acetyl-CoA carboxylase biotin carboxylase subunit [Spirochaeta africana]AFG38249.1 acetyl/propionyl-CoA carboxylase, alpha subunit [Spirochaeta africana DSM 8902]